MKESYYNFNWKTKQGTNVYFNSATCSLAEVDNDFIDILNNIDNLEIDKLTNEKKELLEQMKEGGYIVNSNLDELKLIKFNHFNGKYTSKGLGLTIAPTLNCNFKCIYCYETAKNNVMSNIVQDSIVKFVEKRITTLENLSITWYGGEPLLCKEIIYNLSKQLIELCEKNNVTYNAYIITNGYLIDDEVINNFKKYKITGAQLTIDGPERIHNVRRVLKSGKKDNFEKVLNSIKMLHKAGINPGVRVNVDKSNKAYIDELLSILKENNLEEVDVHFGQVTPYTDSCKSIAHNCFDTEEFSNILLGLQDKLNNNGFSALSHPYYPGIKANYCCSDQINSFVIDPDGLMYKCWNEIGNIDATVGNITLIDSEHKVNEDMMINNLEYMTWSPFESSECIKCKLLPICMGGCPYFRKTSGETHCERWKYNLKEIIQKTYDNYLAYGNEFEQAFK